MVDQWRHVNLQVEPRYGGLRPAVCWKCIMVKKGDLWGWSNFFTWWICTVSMNEKEAKLVKNQMMVRTTHLGSIGAIGLTIASFFHPGEHICNKMDSGFCVAAGILALHHVGLFRQALITKWGQYWPKHVPGNEIEEYMKGKELGHAETYKQCIDRKDSRVHHQQDSNYVTKFMSTYRLVVQEDHTTFCFINGEWKRFTYVEPMSWHNKSKH